MIQFLIDNIVKGYNKIIQFSMSHIDDTPPLNHLWDVPNINHMTNPYTPRRMNIDIRKKQFNAFSQHNLDVVIQESTQYFTNVVISSSIIKHLALYFPEETYINIIDKHYNYSNDAFKLLLKNENFNNNIANIGEYQNTIDLINKIKNVTNNKIEIRLHIVYDYELMKKSYNSEVFDIIDITNIRKYINGIINDDSKYMIGDISLVGINFNIYSAILDPQRLNKTISELNL